MTEQDFARMTTEELENFCKEKQEELDKALWFLRNRKMAEKNFCKGVSQ